MGELPYAVRIVDGGTVEGSGTFLPYPLDEAIHKNLRTAAVYPALCQASMDIAKDFYASKTRNLLDRQQALAHAMISREVTEAYEHGWKWYEVGAFVLGAAAFGFGAGYLAH